MTKNRILAALLAAALALSLAACGGAEDTPQEEPASPGVAVQVQSIGADTIYTENTVSGQLLAEDQSTIMVAVSAKCTAVYAEAGDEVKAGDLLCTLDLGSTLASHNAASISYRSSAQSYNDQSAVFEKQIALAEKNVRDLKELFEIGAASQLEIDQAELQLQSAIAQRNSTLSQLEAGMQNALSNVEQLDTVLENVDARGNVIAPSSGTLVTMNATEGGFISNAAPVAVIDGAEQMKAVVQVSEALVPKLSVGDKADVSVSAANQTFEASIRSVERAANLQTRLYTVTLSLPSDADGLLAGMFADVTFHTDVSENAIVVPTEAVLTRGETQYVFVAEDGAARYVEVTTGLTGNGVTEILTGLAAGQQLVTVGQAYLNDGDPVRIVSGEEAPAPAEAPAESPESGEEAAPQDGRGE
ncbi:MAG: efflux RND transporter periplasmic adaptor subunit [Oscillibacter sp.]|nr:efflux RND transporter periplasmic adaptor subunit [uncultured Oscillibacter sp.]MCI8971402.1 efflux RND transporter periplasmic adaptor subunit [Oscillibacter sp.]